MESRWQSQHPSISSRRRSKLVARPLAWPTPWLKCTGKVLPGLSLMSCSWHAGPCASAGPNTFHAPPIQGPCKAAAAQTCAVTSAVTGTGPDICHMSLNTAALLSCGRTDRSQASAWHGGLVVGRHGHLHAPVPDNYLLSSCLNRRSSRS